MSKQKYLMLNQEYHKREQKQTTQAREVYFKPIELTQEQRYKYENYGWGGHMPFDEDIIQNIYDDSYNPVYTQKNIDTLKKCISGLTPRQQNIINGLLGGKTQSELASDLNVTQGCISLSLYGSYDHIRKRRYGGILKKLKGLIEKETNNGK